MNKIIADGMATITIKRFKELEQTETALSHIGNGGSGIMIYNSGGFGSFTLIKTLSKDETLVAFKKEHDDAIAEKHRLYNIERELYRIKSCWAYKFFKWAFPKY